MVESTLSKQQVRETLRGELSKVRAQITEIKKAEPPEELRAGGDNTPLSEDQDRMTQLQAEELEAARLERLLDRAAKIEQAMQRNEEGFYGICVSCNRPIDRSRLRAIPEAVRCSACQAALEPAEPQPSRAEPRIAGWEEAEEMFCKERYEED